MSVEITRIERHCAEKDMYDDNGYCETKIKKFDRYYVRFVRDEGADCHCSDCILQLIIADKKRNFTYIDEWFTEYEKLTGLKTVKE